MTNEEARNIIEKMCFKVAINSPVQDALTMADMALQNQEKYENALEMAVSDHVIILKKIDTDNEMPVEFLTADGVKYYKRKAGLEADDDKARSD